MSLVATLFHSEYKRRAGPGIIEHALYSHHGYRNAVRQDVFDDVDEEARAMSASTSTPETILDLGVGAHINPEAAVSQTVSPVLITKSVILKEVARTETSKRGVLHHLDKRFPSLLDPERKTLVWGAPPVDNFGKMWKS